MPTDWKQLKNKFQEILNHCTEASTVLDHDMLRPACKEAGKGIFDLIKNDVLDVDFNDSFKIEPIVYDMQDVCGTFYNPEYYDDYWLCILGFLGKKDFITVGNKKLRDSKVPMSGKKVSWEDRFRLESVEKRFFSNETTYLTETCRASIHACGYILRHLGKESSFYVDENNHSIIYNNKTIPFPGSIYWELFLLIYNKKGNPISSEEIAQKTLRVQVNVLIGELKAHLKKIGNSEGAKIAKAIKSQRNVGYYLDSSKL